MTSDAPVCLRAPHCWRGFVRGGASPLAGCGSRSGAGRASARRVVPWRDPDSTHVGSAPALRTIALAVGADGGDPGTDRTAGKAYDPSWVSRRCSAGLCATFRAVRPIAWIGKAPHRGDAAWPRVSPRAARLLPPADLGLALVERDRDPQGVAVRVAEPHVGDIAFDVASGVRGGCGGCGGCGAPCCVGRITHVNTRSPAMRAVNSAAVFGFRFGVRSLYQPCSDGFSRPRISSTAQSMSPTA